MAPFLIAPFLLLLETPQGVVVPGIYLAVVSRCFSFPVIHHGVASLCCLIEVGFKAPESTVPQDDEVMQVSGITSTSVLKVIPISTNRLG